MDTHDTGSSVVRSLRRASRPGDLIGLAVVPAVLFAAFFLPETVKRDLTFSYVDPGPITAYTAHVIHFEWGHVLGNGFGFIILAGTAYVLAVLADRRRLFGITLSTYLIAFPPVLSALNLAVPREAITYGFSGINMSIAGLLPLLLTLYIGHHLVTSVHHSYAPALFFLGVALIAVIAIPLTTITGAVAIASGGAAVGYGYSAVEAGRAGGTTRSGFEVDGNDSGGWIELAALAGFVTFAYPIIGFPPEPAQAGTVMNLYVHFLGYSLAFLVAYIALESGLFDEHPQE